MSQENQITLRGFVTAEPRFRETAKTGTPMTEIRVGSTPRRLNRETGEWQDLPTSYYNIKCWRRLAINTASSLHKGDMVVVRGRFHMNTWVDAQQQRKFSLEIEADSVGHDLAYGWTHFLRGARGGKGQGGDAGEETRQDVSQLTADPQNAEGAEYAGREEDDEFLASSAVDHHYDDDESAEPEPEAAVGDFGISAGDPEISLDGDAERPETAVLAV